MKKLNLFSMFLLVIFSCNNSPEEKTTIYAGKICGFNRLRIGIDTFPCDKKPDYVLFLNQFYGQKPPPKIKNGDSIEVVSIDDILSASIMFDDNYLLQRCLLVKEVYRGKIIYFSNNPDGFCIFDEKKEIHRYYGNIHENLKISDSVLLVKVLGNDVVYLNP